MKNALACALFECSIEEKKCLSLVMLGQFHLHFQGGDCGFGGFSLMLLVHPGDCGLRKQMFLRNLVHKPS